MTVKVTFSSSVNRWVTVTRILLPKCSSKYVGFALSTAVPFLMMNEWNRDSNGFGMAARLSLHCGRLIAFVRAGCKVSPDFLWVR